LAEADRTAAVALWRAGGLTRPWNDPAADYAAALRAPDAALLGAWCGDALVGTILVGWDGHRGWFYYLAIDPGHRRGGLGTALVAAAEAWLAARGAPKAQLMVRDGNEAAAGFWRALGYEAQAVAVFGRWLGTSS
jgi:ribosomal protein S18 acetylase RimI-like enzyme